MNLFKKLYRKGSFHILCCYLKILLVDFRSRILAFLGAGGEPPRRYRSCGVSPVPLLPQESRTFRSNQLLYVTVSNNKIFLEQQGFRKETPMKIKFAP
jgi:hypothetical protein